MSDGASVEVMGECRSGLPRQMYRYMNLGNVLAVKCDGAVSDVSVGYTAYSLR